MESSHSLTHKRTNTAENCRCFWKDKSEACSNIKIGTLSIATALTSIALLAGLFLVLAQQGLHLGGLNAISQMIEANWLYIGLGTAAVILTIDIVFIVLLVRSFLNKTYSEKELEKFGLNETIKREGISEKMSHMTYWKITDVKADLYAVITKDQKGKASVKGFKTEDMRKDFLQTLVTKYQYRNGHEIFEKADKYPTLYALAILGDRFAKDVEPMRKNLPAGFHRIKKIQINSQETMLTLAISKGGQTHIHFIKQGRESAWISETLDRDVVDQLVSDALQLQVKEPLKDKCYWTFRAGGQAPPLFAVALNPQNEVVPPYFLTKKERDDFLAKHCPATEGWINAKKTYKECQLRATMEFEEAEGKAILSLCGFSEALLKKKASYMLNQEYWQLKVNPDKLKDNHLPAIYPIIIKDAVGNVRYRFFRKEEWRSECEKTCILGDYQNGFDRHFVYEKFAQIRAFAHTCESHLTKETKFYLVVEYKDKGLAQFITVSYKDKKNAKDIDLWHPVSQYIKLEKLPALIEEKTRNNFLDIDQIKMSKAEEQWLLDTINKDEPDLSKAGYDLKYFLRKYAIVRVRYNRDTAFPDKKSKLFPASRNALRHIQTFLRKDSSLKDFIKIRASEGDSWLGTTNVVVNNKTPGRKLREFFGLSIAVHKTRIFLRNDPELNKFIERLKGWGYEKLN